MLVCRGLNDQGLLMLDRCSVKAVQTGHGLHLIHFQLVCGLWNFLSPIKQVAGQFTSFANLFLDSCFISGLNLLLKLLCKLSLALIFILAWSLIGRHAET